MPRPRRILLWTVFVLMMVFAVRAMFLQSQVVVSASMADTLLGPHYNVTCADCGCAFACEAEAPAAVRAVCPNCGFASERLGAPVGGTQLWVDRAAFYWHAPQRFDVVVFHSPESDGEPTVKRIVGLPGETIEIRDGDVFADGTIVRKPLNVIRALAAPVHDTAFSPGRIAAVPSRWIMQDSWRRNQSGFSLLQTAAHDLSWLEYRHWQRLPTAPDRVEEAPIRDDDAYNAGRSRRLNNVHDLLLACRIQASGPGQLVFRANDGWQFFDLTVEPSTGRFKLSRGDEALASTELPAPLLASETTIEVALVDQQIICALDGKTCLTYAYDAAGASRTATSHPIEIGARNLAVEISRLQLFRDLYYTDSTAARAAAARSVQLGPEEYFVLGDNSPVSSDSRTWVQPALSAQRLIGKPLGIH